MSLGNASEPAAADVPDTVPIVVDLDGALLCNTSAQEIAFGMLRRGPGHLWRHPELVLSGLDDVRSTLTRLAAEDAATWPVRDETVAHLEEQARRGRKIVLFAPRACIAADALVGRFPFISEIIRPAGSVEVTDDDRAKLLASTYPEGFVYVDRDDRDEDAGKSANHPAIGAEGSWASRFVGHAADAVAQMPSARTIAKCLRIHQWVKNALIFLPAVLDGKAADLSAWVHASIGFIALSLVASATYVINDLWDLADDRRHWSKRKRPLASGAVTISQALVWAGGLLAIGFALTATINWASTLLLGVYLVGTLSYTIRLKRVPILDIMILAGLFTIRLGMGMTLTEAKLSYWLVVFSMFVFTSLCAAKRHTELRRQIEKGQTESRRGYVAADLPLVLAFGLASMFGAILISVLYLIEDAFPSGFYSDPMYLWFVPVLLSLFLSRIWLLSQRGLLNDDPVAFAVTDRTSLALGLLMVVCLVAAFNG